MELIELDIDLYNTFSGVLIDTPKRLQVVKKDVLRHQILRLKGCLAGSIVEIILELDYMDKSCLSWKLHSEVKSS